MSVRINSIAAIAIAAAMWSAGQAAPNTETPSLERELEAVADLLEATADGAGEETVVTVGETENDGLWRPYSAYDPALKIFIDEAGGVSGRDRLARRAVAAKYGLSDSAFDQVLALLREMEKYRYQDGKKDRLRERAIRLVQAANRAPIALMASAAMIDELADGGCDAADVALLMSGSTDRDADLWPVVAGCGSSDAFSIALKDAPRTRPAIQYISLNWTRGDPASELAAADILLSPDFLAQVASQQRDRVQADVARFKLTKLLKVGLLEEALEFGDSLAPSIREHALSADKEEIRTVIGGLPVVNSPYNEPAPADYAASLALAGRVEEAGKVLDIIVPEDTRKAARSCLDSAGSDCMVGRDGTPVAALIVDQLLDRPDRDPYVLIERASIDHDFSGAGVVEAMCRLLSQPGEREICEDRRKLIASYRAEKGEEERPALAFWAAIARVGGRPFEEARSRYAARMASFGPVDDDESYRPRSSADPEPNPFRELPLPAEIASQGPRKSADPKRFGALPEGYHPIRIERSGTRAAAVSLSQRFDPNGEVTAGGYWLHLSEDGGRTWQLPLYTGLAEHFPYVVPANYRMPLIAGDHIRLEVVEALIDTASIFYPPVGTRIRRKREGIYLDIPIADLMRDSDDDGLSDIAARHLLLDQVSPGGTPYVVGRDRNCSAPGAETLARLEILKQLFKVETQAAIEPVGPKREIIGPWRRSAPTDKPPIFLQGNPEEYRCVALDRPMIVYSEADRERLRKFSPDFQLIELPQIRWNRDLSRGFVHWSMGWTGGTYRLVRAGEGWKLESIQEWIT